MEAVQKCSCPIYRAIGGSLTHASRQLEEACRPRASDRQVGRHKCHRWLLRYVTDPALKGGVSWDWKADLGLSYVPGKK